MVANVELSRLGVRARDELPHAHRNGRAAPATPHFHGEDAAPLAEGPQRACRIRGNAPCRSRHLHIAVERGGRQRRARGGCGSSLGLEQQHAFHVAVDWRGEQIFHAGLRVRHAPAISLHRRQNRRGSAPISRARAPRADAQRSNIRQCLAARRDHFGFAPLISTVVPQSYAAERHLMQRRFGFGDDYSFPSARIAFSKSGSRVAHLKMYQRRRQRRRRSR